MTTDSGRTATTSGVVSVQVGTAELAGVWFDAIRSLYDATFSVPPFAWSTDDPEHHRRQLTRVMHEPGFSVVVALVDTTLVGFAYGYTSHPDSPRWTHFVRPLPEDVSAEWEGRTFVLVDMAIQAGWRRRGLGRRLVGALLANRAEERAVLKTEPGAVETGAFYRAMGWQLVGQRAIPDAVVPLWDVYVKQLQVSR